MSFIMCVIKYERFYFMNECDVDTLDTNPMTDEAFWIPAAALSFYGCF